MGRYVWLFFIKKNDKIDEIVQVLNNFYVAAGGQSVMKKRKSTTTTVTKKQQGEKKSKKNNKEIIVEDVDGGDDENECEKLEINEKALLELCYYYEQSNLSLRNCILSFHDQINESLNIEFRFDFLSILKIPKAINNLQKMFDEIIKESYFFLFFRKKNEKKEANNF